MTEAALRKVSVPLFCFAIIGAWSPAARGQMPASPTPSVLPGVSQISAANAAGVLKYCEESGLINEGSADAAIAGAVTKTDETSADYIVGSSGQILGDAGKNFSISRATTDQQSQACNMIFERAKTFKRQR